MRTASLPTDEQTAKAVVPRVGALHNPAPRLAAYFADKRLFTASADVGSNSAQTNRRRDVRVVVTLVEADVVGASRSTGAAHDHSVKDGTDHRGVRHVRAADQRSERHAAAISQNVALDAAFRPVRRIWPGEVPPFGAFTEALSRELHFHAIPRRPS